MSAIAAVRLAFVAALLVACTCPAFAAGRDASIEEVGWIRVTSEPSGLIVIVDGDSAGCTPLEGAAVDPGTHQVAVLPKEHRSFLTRPVGRSVEVHAGETAEVFLRYPHMVNVTSSPFGASAFLDDRYVGRTPFLLELPEVEDDSLELRLAGHETVRVPLAVLKAVGLHWSAALASNPAAPERGLTRIEQARGWSWWRYALLAGAGAGAVGGVSLKTEADHAYDSYRSAGNLERQRTLHDRAQRYDSYSLTAWAAAETFVGVSAFLIIRDQILHRRRASIQEPR